MQHSQTSLPHGPYGVALLALLALASPGWGKVVYVNMKAPGPVHDGTSWQRAFQKVWSGVNAAVSGDEVWVAASAPAAPAYIETTNLKGGVPLYGGFAGTETERSQRDWNANVTVLDANLSTAVTAASHDAVLDGFVIRNGNIGVHVSAATATVTHCTITGNTYGIYGNATITNCNITSNSIGISSAGAMMVASCTVSGNGEGVSIVSDGASIVNCIVAFNQTGIRAPMGTPPSILSHNDVYGNSSSDYSSVVDPTGTSGNISRDPMLTNPYHDTHIQPESPCIDAGDDSAWRSESTDIDGQPRVIGAHVDIGSDESNGKVWSVPTRTWYVSTAGNDTSDGLSWATAKKTVAGGLAVAQGTDEVWVARGAYTGNVTIPTAVSLYGGFAGTEKSRIERDWITNTTSIIDDLTTSTVVTSRYLPGTVIDGLTIVGYTAVYGVFGSATVAHCTISGSAYGVYGYANISHCTISGNTCGVYGPATISDCSIVGNFNLGVSVYNVNGSTIANCTIRDNGGGVDVSGGEATVVSCAIIGNPTGISIYNGEATVSNCTITGGSYGIVSQYAGDINVVNCIVAFNETGLIRAPSGGAVTLSHTDVYGSTTANLTDIPDPIGTNGNISGDPLFVNRTGRDFHLVAGSPCIDTGADTTVHPGDTDVEGRPRRIGARADMGAYEFGPTYYALRDAAQALRFAGGLDAAPSDISRWNVSLSSPGIDALDAIRIARKAAGLEPNP